MGESEITTIILFLDREFPAGIYLLKVNNRKNRTRCEIYSKLTIKTPEYFQTYFTPCSSVSIVNFEHAIAGWAAIYWLKTGDSY